MFKAVGAPVLALAVIPTLAPAQQATGFLDRRVEVEGNVWVYQVFVSRDYTAARSWPVILFLHGAGERGSDGLMQTEVGLGSAIRRAPDRYPAIVVFPQAPEDSSWQGVPSRAALAALDQTIAEFATDRFRVYLTGMSMGGNGTWYLAYHHPERFAAIAVVCGFIRGGRAFPSFVAESLGPPYVRVADRVRHIPTWIVHGAADPVVPVSESRQMYDALVGLGADVHYDELPDVGHDAWDAAYGSADFTTWLFAQRR